MSQVHIITDYYQILSSAARCFRITSSIRASTPLALDRGIHHLLDRHGKASLRRLVKVPLVSHCIYNRTASRGGLWQSYLTIAAAVLGETFECGTTIVFIYQHENAVRTYTTCPLSYVKSQKYRAVEGGAEQPLNPASNVSYKGCCKLQ